MSSKNENTTITDKKDFKPEMIDKKRFSELKPEEQKLFESVRNSVLEIMPMVDNKYPEMCLKLAENFAFINLKAFDEFFKEKVEKAIQAASTASTTPGSTTGGN